jgi:hypothetical protein
MPYTGPDASGHFKDIFVYLRPESNGVLAESAILKVIQHCSAYRTQLFLVYMANVPGDFIAHHKLVERHYAVKLAFAVHGGAIFTPSMRRRFERHFGEPFDQAAPIGAFQALRELGVRANDLFSVWVPESRLLILNGQTIKRVWGRYIVNYDMPALIHKNTAETDIAVMLFRTQTDYDYFSELTREMKDAVVQEGLLSPGQHFTRVFHYSKSPFEQALDARSYLFDGDGSFLGLEASSFGRYWEEHGRSLQELHGLLDNPICTFQQESEGRLVEGRSQGRSDRGGEPESLEEHLSTFTQHDAYDVALEKAKRIVAQAWLVK